MIKVRSLKEILKRDGVIKPGSQFYLQEDQAKELEKEGAVEILEEKGAKKNIFISKDKDK